MNVTEIAHDFQVGVKKYVTEELSVVNSYDIWHGKYKDIATPGCYHTLIRSSAYTRNDVVKAVRKVGQGKVKDEGKVWFGQVRDKSKNLLLY